MQRVTGNKTAPYNRKQRFFAENIRRLRDEMNSYRNHAIGCEIRIRHYQQKIIEEQDKKLFNDRRTQQPQKK